MFDVIKSFFQKKDTKEESNINLDNAWLSFMNSISTEINKSLYMNYAINTGMKIIMRACENVEVGVYTKKNKTFEKSESKSAKYLEQTIKSPNSLHNWNLLVDSYVCGIYLNGSLLMRRVQGLLKDDLYIYNNQYFTVNRHQSTLEISEIFFNNMAVSGDALKNFLVVYEYNPTSIIQGTENGVPRIAALEPIKKLMNGMIAYNVNYMEHGGMLAGILSMESVRTPTKEEENKLKKEFEDNFAGVKNAGKIKIVYGNDPKFTQINATNPKDVDYVEGLKEFEKKIALGIGIPLPLISSDSSTYNNLEIAQKRLYADTIIPLMKEFCQNLTRLFKDELGDGEEFYFDESGIKALQVDLASNIETTVKALTGITTVNNLIKIINGMYNINLEELGVEGDVVLVPGSNVNLKDMTITIPTEANKTQQVQKMIVEENGEYVLYSHDGSKKLGTFKTKKEAEDREREVKYFEQNSKK